jgi:hypothetical protein
VQSRVLTYANAGNQPPLVRHAGGGFEELPLTGYPLGLIEGATYEEGRVQLSVGDLLLVFTDGLVEAQDAGKELYEVERLKESVRRRGKTPLADLVSGLHADVLAFTGGRTLQDDFTLVAVEAVPPRSALHFSFGSRRVEIPGHLDRVMRFAREEAGVADTGDILIALSAALENAICHGNRFDPSRKVFVSAGPSVRGLSVTVSDEGSGFDPAAPPAPPEGRMPGLSKIRASCLATSFNAAGNAITMEFARG